MEHNKDKLPNFDGLKKAKEILRDLYDKQPSEDLLNIISGDQKNEETKKVPFEKDIAAKGTPAQPSASL